MSNLRSSKSGQIWPITLSKVYQTHQILEKHRPLKLKKVLEEIEHFLERKWKIGEGLWLRKHIKHKS